MNPEIAKELLKLRPLKVNLNELWLDPNNPRFGTELSRPDSEITKESVQSAAQEAINEIGIDDLLRKIRENGFLPIDTIAVRKLTENNYVVLEGNRRVAALKRLVEARGRGDTFSDDGQLDKDLLASMESFNVLVYDGQNPDIVWILQGLRHMRGIKAWPALQQAVFVSKIEQQLISRAGKNGRPPKIPTIAKAAGIENAAAKRLLYSYYAIRQAREDDEYGDKIDDRKFSMFDEAIFVKPSLQAWLEWSDDKKRFENVTNLNKFLGWITKPDDDNQAKIVAALDVRNVLAGIVLDSELLQKFDNGDIDINQARLEVGRVKPSDGLDLEQVKKRLESSLNVLDSLPITKIKREGRKSDFLRLLTVTHATISEHLFSLGN